MEDHIPQMSNTKQHLDYKVERLLTGLLRQESGITSRFYPNKTPLVFALNQRVQLTCYSQNCTTTV